MLLGAGDPTILILAAILVIGAAELVLRFSGLAAERSRIVAATHRVRAVVACVVAIGFFFTLPAGGFGDAIGALILGMIVGACLWPLLYLVTTILFFLWANVLSGLWRLVNGFVSAVLLAPLRLVFDVFSTNRGRLDSHERHETPRSDPNDRLNERTIRENARMECQLYLDRNREQLEPQFDQQRLDDYFSAYMNDGQPIEVVQARSKKLLEMMRGCVESMDERSRFESLPAIARHFEALRREIERETSYDPLTKETLIAAINLQEEDAIRLFLQQ